MNSSLFSSMSCNVSVQEDLGRSLEYLLKRMGLGLASGPEDPLYTNVDFRVEIGLAKPHAKDASLGSLSAFYTTGRFRREAIVGYQTVATALPVINPWAATDGNGPGTKTEPAAKQISGTPG